MTNPLMKQGVYRGSGGIGEAGLRDLADELNLERDRHGIRERYYIARIDNVLTLQDEAQGLRR